MTTPSLFHSLTFQDAQAGMAFMEVLGFRKAAVYTDETDPSIVVHGEYHWGENGGVMFGSQSPDRPFARTTGQAKCYFVVDSDADVDRIYEAALAAGATSIGEPENPDYGGRGASVADLEGNLWSFGSYRGAGA